MRPAHSPAPPLLSAPGVRGNPRPQVAAQPGSSARGSEDLFEFSADLSDEAVHLPPLRPRPDLTGSPNSSRSGASDIFGEAMGTLITSLQAPAPPRQPLRAPRSTSDLRRGSPGPAPSIPLPPLPSPSTPTAPVAPAAPAGSINQPWPTRMRSPASGGDVDPQDVLRRLVRLEVLEDTRRRTQAKAAAQAEPLPPGWRRVQTRDGTVVVSRAAVGALARAVAIEEAPSSANGGEATLYVDMPQRVLPLLVHATTGYMLATLATEELWLLRDAAHKNRVTQVLANVHSELQRRGYEAGAQILLSRDVRLRRVYLFEQLCHKALESRGHGGGHLQAGQHFVLQLALADLPANLKKNTPISRLEIHGPQNAYANDLHQACEALRAWLEPFKFTWTSANLAMPTQTGNAPYLELYCAHAGA